MSQHNEMQNFEQRLKQLVAKARSNKDVLEVDKINDFFKLFASHIARLPILHNKIKQTNLIGFR